MRAAIVALLVFWLGWGSWWLILLNPRHPNRAQLAEGWGWLGAGMTVHWARFRRGDVGDPFTHRAKNLGAEWVELLSQRGYKVLCWLGGNLLLAGFVTGVLGGFLLGHG